MKNFIKPVLAISLITVALSANAEDLSVESTVTSETTVESYIEASPIEAISSDEEAGLIFMREEEKLARDVYLTLYDIWGLKVFSSIAESEQTHTDTMKMLLDKYQIADPVLDDSIGVFTDQHFTEIFEALVAKGRESLEGALQVGAQIEDLDMKDIVESIEVVEGNDDIVMVYEELLKGSRNHLRSFWDVLVKNGFTYTPLYISQEEFDSIINSPMELSNLK
ncbi:MAG: DUF2202 domain-containing protein [Pseudomonadota bacterium]